MDAEQVKDIASAISRYLTSRPDACDTIDGIARWWLARQRYEDSLLLVQEALDHLESSGEVLKLPMPGGKVAYRRLPPA